MVEDNALQEMVNVARDGTPEARSRLMETLNTVCLSSAKNLSERERELVFEILTTLVKQVEASVRSALAKELAERQDVPKDLMVTLANDVIDVASPVLAKSALLDDQDLIQLIIEKAEQHQIAIAKRPNISGSVSGALADTGNKQVITSLLHNKSAEIYEDTLENLVNDSELNQEYQAPLLQRPELSSDMAQRMYNWVGDTLRSFIEDRYESLNPTLAAAVSKAVDEALHDDIYADGEQDPSLRTQSMTGYRPHPRMLVNALKEGDVFRFEELFQDLTDMSASSVTRVLYDSGPETLAIVCKATGVDSYAFSDIISYLHGGGDLSNYRQNPQYTKSMDYFERIDAAGAVKVLQAWREAPTESW